MNGFVFQKVRDRVRFNGAEGECNVFTFGKKKSVYAKNMGFLLPVLKNHKNTDVKAPTSHILNTTMDSLLEGCGDVSEDSDSCLAISWSPEGRWVVLLIPGPQSQHKADLPWRDLLPPCPKELSEGSLCSVGLWDLGCAGTELTGTTGPSPVQKAEQGTALSLFLTSPLRRALPTEGSYLPQF